MFNFFNKKKTLEEGFIDQLEIHPQLKQQVRGAFNRSVANIYPDTPEGRTDRASDLKIIRDVSDVAVTSTKAFGTGFTSVGGGREIAGYAPAGSILRKVYPNEFTCMSFIAEAYWACVKARKELWVETDRDGYSLVTGDSVAKRDVKLIDKVLKDLKVPYMRNKLRDTLLTCGNVVLDNKYNKRGGLLELNPLLMELVSPKYNPVGNDMQGWYYESGNKKLFFPYDSVDHIKTYNSRSNILGAPCCSSLMVDIEAALQAAIYNNNLMQKGGLLSVLIGLREPKTAAFTNDQVSLNLAEEFTRWLDRKYSGIRGGGGMVFLPMVENVTILNKISEMDGAWINIEERTSRKASLLYGVPPERIGIPTGSQYKNITNVTDSLALSFDNNNYYVQGIVDDYLTNLIIKEQMGIDNIRIESSGEFSAISKTGAEFGMLIATNGADTLTVNELRCDVLHIDPLEGPLGDKFLGDFLRKDKTAPGGIGVKDEDLNDLTRAIGSAKTSLPAYSKYVVNKTKYKSKDIPYI